MVFAHLQEASVTIADMLEVERVFSFLGTCHTSRSVVTSVFPLILEPLPMIPPHRYSPRQHGTQSTGLFHPISAASPRVDGTSGALIIFSKQCHCVKGISRHILQSVL